MCRIGIKFRDVADKWHGGPRGQQPMDETDGHRPEGEERHAEPGAVFLGPRIKSVST